MTAGEIREALRDIGLALNACHNTVATDSPDAEPDEHGWRIDNGREIEQLRALERALLPDLDGGLISFKQNVNHSLSPPPGA